MTDTRLTQDAFLDGGALDAGAERAARRSATLKALAEVGMAIARALVDGVQEADSAEAIDERMLALTRVAQSVRLTIALDVRLAAAQRMRRETRKAEAGKDADVSDKAATEAWAEGLTNGPPFRRLN